METVDKTEQKNKKTYFTKVKFEYSKEKNTCIAFVTKQNGFLFGVRSTDERLKKICIPAPKLAGTILPNVLYNVTLVPTKNEKGFIVTDASVIQFPAKIETEYVPKAIYRVLVKFGNKTISFDPHDGIRPVKYSYACVRNILEERCDIKNIQDVLQEFDAAAKALLTRYKSDGFYERQ